VCWLDCSVGEIFDAGDHFIVTGEVTAFGQPAMLRPLLFFRGAYAVIERPQPSTAILTNLITWTQHYDHDEVWM
jgi:3-hydroxy-9,10-secoandrosta-1,3,5(10)-triene-9,17-dione monooxygenase reductase component